MLILDRMIHPYEVRTCALTGSMIVYGDYFYEDNTDGICVLAREYIKLKRARQKESFDYSLLSQAQSEKEYANMLKQAEKEMLQMNLLSRPIIDNGELKESGVF